MKNERNDVISSVGKRRRFSLAEKRRLVAATLKPGASVAAVAREAGIRATQLYGWQLRLRGSTPKGFCAGADRAGGVGRRNAGDRFCHRRAHAYQWRGGHRGDGGGRCGAGAGPTAMIPIGSGVRVWIATGHTDMRRGMNTLALMVQETLRRNPHGGDLYVFRGKSGKLIKVLWHDGIGMSLYLKRLERGRFVWPQTSDGAVSITPAQLGYLLEGIDWRNPVHSWRPLAAG